MTDASFTTLVFNATFNNISVLLMEKTTDLSQVTDKLYHKDVWNTPRMSGVRTHKISGDRH